MLGISSMPAVIRYASATTNIVFHGNSLVLGASGATNPMPAQVQGLPPINGTPCVNLGVNGQSIPAMINTSGAACDAQFLAGKKNVLVIWEGHNTINGLGETPAQAFADMQTYCAARLAAHPWIMVHMTLLPARYTGDTDAVCAARNVKFNTFSDLLRANYKATGANAIVDVRQAGSPFNVPDYTQASFDAVGLWSTGDGGQWVHLSNAGYAVVAQMVAATLRRLSVR